MMENIKFTRVILYIENITTPRDKNYFISKLLSQVMVFKVNGYKRNFRYVRLSK